jgi:hypothetical protein
LWELSLAPVVAVGAPELNDPIGKFCIDDVTVVQGTPDGLMGRVTFHKILEVEILPRLLQVVLLPAELGLTVGAAHLKSELAAAGVMQTVQSKNFSTGRTAWIFLATRWAEVVSDDLLFFCLRIRHSRATC